MLLTCASIAACDDFEDIVAWGEQHLDFLRQFAELHFSIPCVRWLQTLVNRLDPVLFGRCFESWIKQLCPIGAISKGAEALFLLVNEPNEQIRFRYLHMSPDRMDTAGLLTGKRVAEGAKLEKVGNYLEGKENNTTYHLHFDIQVPTKDGWVWVNPFMTLEEVEADRRDDEEVHGDNIGSMIA